MLNRFTMPSLIAQQDFWMPAVASDYAGDVDGLFYFIFWTSAVFFIGIVGSMVYFTFRYRKPRGAPAEGNITHNTTIELLWSGIPLVLLIIMFYIGVVDFLKIYVIPQDAYEVNVTARRWNWEFNYPNGLTSANLYVQKDRPTVLTMRSEDVIHSLYVPAFRAKRDVVPGRYSKLYFTPTLVPARRPDGTAGAYELFCTEYCGDKHSTMMAMVFVAEDDAEYERFMKELDKPLPPAQRGERIARLKCTSCHSVDGSANTGPTWKDLYGLPNHVMDKPPGYVVPVDDYENYIRESILLPQEKIVRGYGPISAMQSFQGQLTDRQIEDLIWYMKSISKYYTGVLPTLEDEAAAATTQPAADAPADAQTATQTTN